MLYYFKMHCQNFDIKKVVQKKFLQSKGYYLEKMYMYIFDMFFLKKKTEFY